MLGDRSGKRLWLALAAIAAVSTAGVAQQAAKTWVPVKRIDFSPKHDVLIQNDDGTRQPMDVPYYRSKLIGPGVWQIESDGDYHYLVEGDREALAIDSGYGAGNLREYLQTLTRKPVRYVANTHYHFDHTANDAYFDAAYQSKDTAEKATIPYPSFAGMTFPRDYPRRIVQDGQKIDLGNRVLTVLIVPNHTPGGTAFLDPKSRILFSGDEVLGRSEPLNVSVAQFAANMRKLAAHRDEYDRLAGGPGLFDATDIDKFLAAAEAVLAGKEGAPQGGPGGPGGPPGGGMGPGGPGGPGATAPDPQGRTVYQRRRVRAPDRAGGGGGPNPNMRVMVSGDRQITYDMRHIQN